MTAILSNGSPRMLDAAVNAAKLDTLLDAVLSVEEVGVYKPHPKVCQLAVERPGIPASAISFQSSNARDAYAASAFGMKVVWCNRYRQRAERLLTSKGRRVIGRTGAVRVLVATERSRSTSARERRVWGAVVRSLLRGELSLHGGPWIRVTCRAERFERMSVFW